MTTALGQVDLGDFTNDEIKAEYIERFGDPTPDVGDFSSSDMIEELESRNEMPEADAPDSLDEIADLIAEAARTSRHAARAYELLRDAYPDALATLAGRQRLIAGRMEDAA